MAIPYATWANRGRGQMAVWLARTDAAAQPTPYPTIATTSTLTQLAEHGAKNTSEHHRRRGAACVERLDVVLRLVADAGQCGRVGRDGLRQAVGGVGVAGLLVRRHRPRRRPRASSWRLLYKDGDGGSRSRRPATTASPGRLQHASVQAGHDGRLADRAHHAAERSPPACRSGRSSRRRPSEKRPVEIGLGTTARPTCSADDIRRTTCSIELV